MLEEFQDLGIVNAKEQIISIIEEGYYLYAIRDDAAAFGREDLARQIHSYYQARYSDSMRIDLPDFKLLRYFAIESFFADQQFSDYLKGRLLARIEVERPELLKQLQELRQETDKEQQEAQQPK